MKLVTRDGGSHGVEPTGDQLLNSHRRTENAIAAIAAVAPIENKTLRKNSLALWPSMSIWPLRLQPQFGQSEAGKPVSVWPFNPEATHPTDALAC